MKKNFIVTYLPEGREDKEWMNVQARDKDQIKKEFKGGIILRIEDND